MCGIGLLLGDNGDREIINQIIKKLNHRGPDGSGIYKNNQITMGHTRLRIIDDNERSNQPMHSKCRRYTIIFNGEIYNYKNLRSEFNLNNLQTSSDTEILLELFIKLGEKTNLYLKGMFSYAIWDDFEKKLFCAVDHFGIKPLYYSHFKNNLIICSEPGVIANLQKNKSPNYQTIYDYLNFGLCDHSNMTFYKDIFKLQGGNQLWADLDGKISITKYWELNNPTSSVEEISYEMAKESLYEKLSNTVRSGTVSDMPVGLCMSGGLDSSTMLEILSGYDDLNLGDKGLTGFTCDYSYSKYSEYKYTKYISDRFSLDLKRILFSVDDFIDWFHISNLQQGEPQTGLPILCYSKCFKEARARGYKVLLDASGIDEFCGGYSKYNKFANVANVPGSTYSYSDKNLRISQDGTSGIAFDCLNDDFAKEYATEEFKIINNFNSILKMNLYLDMTYFKLPRALRFRDRLSMSYGCELRPPFLDHELVSYFFKLPDDYLIKDNINKKIVRDIMSEKIPKNIALEPKRQVQTPQREWFRENLREWIISRINKSTLYDLGILNRKESLKKLNTYMQGIGNNSMFIWQWLDLDLWIKNNF